MLQSTCIRQKNGAELRTSASIQHSVAHGVDMGATQFRDVGGVVKKHTPQMMTFQCRNFPTWRPDRDLHFTPCISRSVGTCAEFNVLLDVLIEEISVRAGISKVASIQCCIGAIATQGNESHQLRPPFNVHGYQQFV